MSAKQKSEVRRVAQSASRPIRIHLSQINADFEKKFCHRQPDALKADKLKLLAANLVAEGQQTPLTVYDSGSTDQQGRKVYVLVGGFRRFHALQSANKQHLDEARIHDDMEVDAVEVVPGSEQSEADFRKDLLVRSVAENEQRLNFTTAEKLLIVKQFEEAKIPAPRAASSLGISDTQYSRFVAVASHDWLHQYVVQNCIGMTDAAELIMLATKHERVREFKADLDAWVMHHKEVIEQERQELAKVGKKLSGSGEHVKKFLSRKDVDHWAALLKEKKRFGGKPEFQFGIVFDKGKGTITVPGRVFKATELAVAEYETMIGELQDAVEELVPLLRERQVIEQARQLSEEDKRKELARILDARRQRKAQQTKDNAGRPAPGFGEAAPPRPSEVDVEDEDAVTEEPAEEQQ
jgi:hypothetical protein